MNRQVRARPRTHRPVEGAAVTGDVGVGPKHLCPAHICQLGGGEVAAEQDVLRAGAEKGGGVAGMAERGWAERPRQAGLGWALVECTTMLGCWAVLDQARPGAS